MDLLKGTLDILILRTLRDGAMHGYGISRVIREHSREVLQVEEGALYPALRRLEKRGLLSSRWGRSDTGREAKFYELTDAGRDELRRSVDDWNTYVEAMANVLERGGSE